MRASSNIWEQITATPCTCLRQQPAHQASMLLHSILYKTHMEGGMKDLGGWGTVSLISSFPFFLTPKAHHNFCKYLPPNTFALVLCAVSWIKVFFSQLEPPRLCLPYCQGTSQMFPCHLQQRLALLFLIRELRGFPRHFPVKPSPLNEWQATSLGVGSKVTQQLFGNRQLVKCARFRDSASLKTKATFKSWRVYLGHWYPGDIGYGRWAAGAGSLCSEPGWAKPDGLCICTLPRTESWVYKSFLCSGTWSCYAVH